MIGRRLTAFLTAVLLLPLLASCAGDTEPGPAAEASGTDPAAGLPVTAPETEKPAEPEPEVPADDGEETEAAEEPEPEVNREAEPEAIPESEPAADEPEPEPEPQPEEPADAVPDPWSDPDLYALYLDRAVEYAKTIHELYWDGETLLSRLTPSGGVPHLWPFTEQAGMVNGILAAMPADHPDRAYFETWLHELIGGLRHYRVRRVKLTDGQSWTDPDSFIADFGENDGTAHGYAVYSSSRHDKKQDYLIVTPDSVYFDDNVWVAKEFVAAWRNTGEEAYLNEAVNILNWILGEGYEDAGALAGIYWKWSTRFLFKGGNYSDSDHASLNACSTVSCAMVLAQLCDAVRGTGFESRVGEWLEKADAMMRFAGEAYVDPSTKCLYDKVFLKEDFASQSGLKRQILKTDTAQYAYNTGTYLTAGAFLYRLLDDRDRAGELLSAALESAGGADRKFADRGVKKGQYSYPSHSWFTSFLVSGFSDLAPYDEGCREYVEHMRSALDYAWDNERADDGLVSPSWIKGWSRFTNNSPDSEDNPRQILYQSANAHCYAMLAEYYG